MYANGDCETNDLAGPLGFGGVPVRWDEESSSNAEDAGTGRERNDADRSGGSLFAEADIEARLGRPERIDMAYKVRYESSLRLSSR